MLAEIFDIAPELGKQVHVVNVGPIKVMSQWNLLWDSWEIVTSALGGCSKMVAASASARTVL